MDVEIMPYVNYSNALILGAASNGEDSFNIYPQCVNTIFMGKDYDIPDKLQQYLDEAGTKVYFSNSSVSIPP